MSERATLTEADMTHDNIGLSPTLDTVEEVLTKHTHCALCGGYLHMTHVTDFIRNLTQETARCPECGVRARKLTHRLQ